VKEGRKRKEGGGGGGGAEGSAKLSLALLDEPALPNCDVLRSHTFKIR